LSINEFIQATGKGFYSSIRPFACSICGRSFNRSSTLAVHKRKHTGERPFECNFPGCTKKFSQKGNLVAHKKIHSKTNCTIVEDIKKIESNANADEKAQEKEKEKEDTKITIKLSPQKRLLPPISLLDVKKKVFPSQIQIVPIFYPVATPIYLFNPSYFQPKYMQ
jgi:uncharacterized Zn-finger protein